jgi:hypothetical protein
MVHDNGAIGCEGTRAALLEQRFVGLVMVRTLTRNDMMDWSSTSRMYFTRVLYGMPLTTTPVMFWSSLGTTKCAATVAAKKAMLTKVGKYIVNRGGDLLLVIVLWTTGGKWDSMSLGLFYTIKIHCMSRRARVHLRQGVWYPVR